MPLASYSLETHRCQAETHLALEASGCSCLMIFPISAKLVAPLHEQSTGALLPHRQMC